MIQCEYCARSFVDSSNGLVEKTFHELLHGAKVVNR